MSLISFSYLCHKMYIKLYKYRTNIHSHLDFLGCLESVLPRLKFVDITERELEYFKSDNEVGREPKIDAEVLITDNPYIGPLIYNRNLPFKFIQV